MWEIPETNDPIPLPLQFKIVSFETLENLEHLENLRHPDLWAGQILLNWANPKVKITKIFNMFALFPDFFFCVSKFAKAWAPNKANSSNILKNLKISKF